MKIYAIYVVRNSVKPAKSIVDVKDLAGFGFFQRSRYITWMEPRTSIFCDASGKLGLTMGHFFIYFHIALESS